MKKKLLSILLSILMLASFVPSVVLAEDGDLGTDTTDIVAVVPEPAFEVTMVIPDNVPQIDNFGVRQVGKAYVKDVKNAKDNHVVSYTASGTDFINTSDSNKKITATYYSNEAGTTAFPTDSVIVYEKKDYVKDLPTMYVKIAESDWTNATPGTYKATVTYNFKLEEVTPKKVAYIPGNIKDVSNVSFSKALSDGKYSRFYFTNSDPIYFISFDYALDDGREYVDANYYIVGDDVITMATGLSDSIVYYIQSWTSSDTVPEGGTKLDNLATMAEYFATNFPLND